MSVALVENTGGAQQVLGNRNANRGAASGSAPADLGAIYAKEINIAIWERDLPITLTQSVARFVAANPNFQDAFTVRPKCAHTSIKKSLAGSGQAELSEDIARLVEMFCFLFDLKRVGLRLATLDRAMCPRFHVDRVPCRLVTTYFGAATEWLPHAAVDRSKLGPRAQGLADNECGVFQNSNDIRQLCSGDVALLKGESWKGNENAGLVHRSPALAPAQNRLLLTLDFCD